MKSTRAVEAGERETAESIAGVLMLLDLSHRIRQRLRGQTWDISRLTLEQAIVLCQLDLAGGSVTIGQLAAALDRTSHTTTGRVNTLEQRGLVTRRRSAGKDRRVVEVGITPEGADRLLQYRQAASELLDSLASEPADSRALERLVRLARVVLNEMVSP